MSDSNGLLGNYLARGWRPVPVHRPDPSTGTCSCGQECNKPGKHPLGAFWPGGSTDPAHFEGRNIGVQLGPVSKDLADVDLDSTPAVAVAPYLLPATQCGFGRGIHQTHWFFTVTDRAACYLKLEDPTLSGDQCTIVELRWPDWDEQEKRHKALQTVIPPSLHYTGQNLKWFRDGQPSVIPGADLVSAVRHIGAAVLIARHAAPKKRHDLVLLLANLLIRAGWDNDRAVRFITAVFEAKKDPVKAAKVADSEGLGAVKDARKRLEHGKPMSGLPALRAMVNPAIDSTAAETIVARIKEWLGIPDSPKATVGGLPTGPSSSQQKPYIPLPDWVPFPVDTLPAPWAEFTREGARSLKCDPAFVALPLIAVLAGAIGNSRRVYVGGEWFEPAVWWSCIVGVSGTQKSPAAELSVNLVNQRQKELMNEYRNDQKSYKRDLAAWKAENRGKGEEAEGRPERPVPKRVLVSDITIEKLSVLLEENPRGLLSYRDELAGWYGSFQRYKGKSGGSDEPNWLSVHGARAIIYDRKTGEKTTVYVPHAAVSVTGGIQPKTLARLLGQESFDSGLVARVMLAYPPRIPKEWSDDPIDAAVKAAAGRSLAALYALSPEVDDEGDPRPVVVKLSREARTRFKEFVNEWGKRHFQADDEIAAALAKLEGMAARFALIHHVTTHAADLGDTDPIELASVEVGVQVVTWAAGETERVYQLLRETDDQRRVRCLVELIKRHGGRITAFELKQTNRSKYLTTTAATEVLDRLVALGLGVWEDRPPAAKGGRPTKAFVLQLPIPETTETPATEPPGGGEDELGGAAGNPNPDLPVHGTDSAPSSVTAEGDSISEDGAEDQVEVSAVSGSGEQTPNGMIESIEVEDPFPPVYGGFRTNPSTSASPDFGITFITTSLGIMTLAEAVSGWQRPVALDTETTGLDALCDRVRLLQVALGDDTAIIDLFVLDEPMPALAPLFVALAEKEVIGHNLQFDLRMLAPMGFIPGRAFDTMLASRIVHAGERGDGNTRLRHGLEDVVDRELGRPLDKSLQDSDWSGPLTPDQLAYAATDVQVLLPLAETLKAKLADAGLSAVAELEMRALPGVAWCGPVTVDTTAWTAQAASAEAELAILKERMDALAPNPNCLPGTESWNWNSPDDVRQAFQDLGVTLDSTDDTALAATDHPLAALVREFRGISKRVGAYGRGWLEKYAGQDSRVLPSWNQLGAESGRMSCSEPNLQQIPRGSDYRTCLIAFPGRVLVKADYSQVELRIAAKVANEEVMIQAYREGRDLHRLTAARVLGKAEADVTKSDRQIAKSLNFGLLYGMGWRGLKGYALTNYGVNLTDSEARAYREAFFRTYPALAAWHRRVEREVKAHFRMNRDGTHELWTLGGRRRFLPVAKKRSDGTPYPNVTEALNFPVQGTGADGLKGAISRLWRTREECPSAVPVIYCHDEVVLEVAKADAEKASEWLRRCMVEAVAPLIAPVPVEVEVSAGRTWAG